ncbi:MAG: hypothetical protein II875_02435 [Clostridia bacterium]|nr:hypothetical protein [Clostridia bacterium]
MKTQKIRNLEVTHSDEITDDEIEQYVALELQHYPTATSMVVELDGEFVNITVHSPMRPFERIRRITGYLVGTMPRWNDAKRAEERDRVKHSF